MMEEGEQIQREQDAAKGIPSRHETHYGFSHISLPARVLDPGGLEFVEELMGKRGCRLLANVWNQVGGQKINRSDKTNQLDFERVWSDITDRWKAIVITPPPALEPLEAHLIGIWRDYSPNDPLPGAADPSAANAQRDVRYFCLERGHTEGMTMVGEWLGFADRKNLGPGPEPVPEAMIYFMAKLHGIDPTFGNRSWTPSDSIRSETYCDHCQAIRLADGRPADGILLGRPVPRGALLCCSCGKFTSYELQTDLTRTGMRNDHNAWAAATKAAWRLKALEIKEAVLRRELERDDLTKVDRSKWRTELQRTRDSLVRERAFGVGGVTGVTAGGQLTTDEPVPRARRGGPAKARRSRPVSVANELKKLAALRDDDVISEQEFQTLKQQLIEGA